MTDLTELLELVRAAEGPDRDLDGLIEATFAVGPYGGEVIPAKGGMVVYAGTGPHAPGQGRFEIAEKYTASIDAALAAAKKELPDWEWSIALYADGSADVEAWNGQFGGAAREVKSGLCRSLPLAITAALLSAKLQEKPDG